MKKYLILLTVMLTFFATKSESSLITIGAHGGMDMVTIESYEKSFELESQEMVTFKRDEISNPMLIGGKVSLDLLPIIDLEVGADFAWKEYHWRYVTPIYSDNGDVTFARINVNFTVKRTFLSFPPAVKVFSVYGGLGGDLQFITPVLCEKLIVENLETASEKMDAVELVKKGTKSGFHILAGVKFKPPVMPVGVDVNVKYILSSKGDYEEPGSFSSVYGGLFVSF